MKGRRSITVLMLALCTLCIGNVFAQRNFKEMVGSTSVGTVTETSPLVVPFITWGGDIATFYANGGLTTEPKTIFHKQGLNLKLVPGDDFIQQVRNYQAGW